jgi:hypothetical protein
VSHRSPDLTRQRLALARHVLDDPHRTRRAALLIAVLALAVAVPLGALGYLLAAGAGSVCLTSAALAASGGAVVSARLTSRRASRR